MPNDFVPAHGGQLRELATEFGIAEESLLDFSASINPLVPSDVLVATLCNLIHARKILTTYPDMHYSALKLAIAEYAQVDARTIGIGNGVMPLLGVAVRALGLRKCLVPVPAFTEYRRVLASCGTECCTLVGKREDELSIDRGRVIAALKTTGAQAVLLANPQSPSGSLLQSEELGCLHEAAAALGVTTIVDEAFIDYAPEESLSHAAAESHGLVVLRSLTKFFAMPGLRVAYAVAHPEFSAAMDAFMAPWPVDSIAAEAARLALEDRASIAAARATNAREREWLADRLRSLGLKVFPSEANYLLLRIDEGRNGLELWRRLVVEHQVVIRNCANFEGLDEHYFRIGVCTRFENQILVDALTKVLRSTLIPATPAAAIDVVLDYSDAPVSPQTRPDALTIIRIVAALVQDEERRVLLVRKKGTRAFMQPGGKLKHSETQLAAIERELGEELGCSVRPGSPVFLGTFTAPAANESDCLVEAALYQVELEGTICAASEIEEITWIDPHSPGQVELAPLTRDKVLPLARVGPRR